MMSHCPRKGGVVLSVPKIQFTTAVDEEEPHHHLDLFSLDLDLGLNYNCPNTFGTNIKIHTIVLAVVLQNARAAGDDTAWFSSNY